jgi:lysozyme
MEFYEQGVLLFNNAKTLSSALGGIDGDLYIAAADAFMQWTRGGGKELPGLVKRRKAEKALFLS